MISTAGTAALLALATLVACERTDAGPREPAGEAAFHVPLLERVLEGGERWSGYPMPPLYCVAIAATPEPPDPHQARDPAQSLLDTLSARDGTRTFVAYSSCDISPRRVTGPTGEPAGVLWVEPLEGADRRSLRGWWWDASRGDMTTWYCTFDQAAGQVELEGCDLAAET